MCKMLANALLLLLPAVVYGNKSGIYIDIVASSKLDNSYVSFRGEIKEIIPNEELAAWRLNDNNLLKDFVMKYRLRRPDDVYLKSPTPWDDLYSRFHWLQVERTLVPTSTKILDIFEVETNHTEYYYNNYFKSHPTTLYTVPSVFDKVVREITSTWTKKELHIGQQISYNVNMLIDDNRKISHLDYKLKWGKDSTQSKIIYIVPRYMLSRNITPGQGVLTKITLKRKVLEIEVKYTATLDGSVACNYANKFNGSHFWRTAIRDVLLANGLPYTMSSTEIIRIVFYPLMHLTVTDPNPRTKKPFFYNGPLEIFED